MALKEMMVELLLETTEVEAVVPAKLVTSMAKDTEVMDFRTL
jgi:hypothetical protein